MKTTCNGLVTVLLSMAWAATAFPVRADTPAPEPTLTDRVTATQLFKEGRQLLQQGHVAEACQKLEESERLEPGGGTLLNVALCHERQGRNASAWVEFTEALGMAKQDGRVQRVLFAQLHLSQLEPTLSRLTILVPAVSDVPGLEIKRDGAVVGRAAWGSAIPVDPGLHLLQARAPDRSGWRQAVQVGPSVDSKTVVVPTLEAAETPEPAPALGWQSSPRATQPSETSPPRPTSRSAPKRNTSVGASVPGWLCVGAGAAALTVGGYFGIRAVEQKHDSDLNCPNDACSALGARQSRDAIRSGNWATVSFGVGAVALGIGTLLVLTGAPARHAQEEKQSRFKSAFDDALRSISIGPSEVTATRHF